MWKIEQALERIVGKAPAFMRPPYGNYNNLVRQVAKQRGQACTSSFFSRFAGSFRTGDVSILIFAHFSGSGPVGL